MTPNDVRALWVKEMASGDHTFVKGTWNKAIRIANSEEIKWGHCALGVLGVVAERHGVGTTSISGIVDRYDVLCWAGLDDKSVVKVTQINDHHNTQDFGPCIQFVESLPLPEQGTK